MLLFLHGITEFKLIRIFDEFLLHESVSVHANLFFLLKIIFGTQKRSISVSNYYTVVCSVF